MNAVLAFGDHRLDIARRELRRGGDLLAQPRRATCHQPPAQ